MQLPITLEMVKAYQERLVQDVQGNRLMGTVKAARPRWQDRLMLRAGNWLIAIGQRLREHARPPVCALPDPCASAGGKVSA